MKLSQTWLGYIDRSYEQIKSKVLSRLGVKAPEITDHTESNPFIILVSILAGIGETIHLYIDNMAREAFLPTARKYSSVVKLVKLVNYHIKSNTAATVEVSFTLMKDNQVATYISDITIPLGTVVVAPDTNTSFVVTADTILKAGTSTVMVPTKQALAINDILLGNTSSNFDENQQFKLPDNYEDSSLILTVGGDTNWKLYRTNTEMTPETLGVTVQVNEDMEAILTFGDGVNGVIPPTNAPIVISYNETLGAAGNLSPNTITNLETVIDLPDNTYTLVVNNPGYAVGGAGFEDIESIRRKAPLSVSTLNRAVTAKDYEDLSVLYPGVGYAKVSYTSGRTIPILISPSTRGYASAELLTGLKAYLKERAMITTCPNPIAAGISRLWLQINIVASSSGYTDQQVLDAVYDSLESQYGYNGGKLTKSVSLTKIMGTLEDLDEVESADIVAAKVEPFVRPLTSGLSPLLVNFLTLPTTAVGYPYRLVYRSNTGTFQVYRNGVLVGEVLPNATFTDLPYTSFIIPPGSYTNGDAWSFNVQPSFPEIFPSYSINFTDYTVCLVDISPFVDETTPRTIFGQISIVSPGVEANNCNI